MLRKLLSFCALMVLGSATTFGQVLFGIQGSGQVSNFAVSIPSVPQSTFDVSTLFKSRVGFRAGVMADIAFTEQLSVRPQLLYSVKGTKIDFNSLLGGAGVDPEQFRATLAYNYLEIPIQLIYKLEAGPGQIAIGAGPYVSYLLSANSVSAGQTEKADLTNEKRIDYGLNASVGYELPLGVTLSAYYSYGLANHASNSSTGVPGSTTSDGSVYHRDFGLTVGYFFGGSR